MTKMRKARKNTDPMDTALSLARVVSRVIMGGLYAHAGVLVTTPEFFDVGSGNLFFALYSGGCATVLVYVDHITRRSTSKSTVYRSNRSWKELTLR